jgi:hypothetical protein
MTELHEKYAPILQFNQAEKFFPMRVSDMLAYSSLYVKGQAKPVVSQGQVATEHLIQYGRSPEVFVRSVDLGPLSGADVVDQWGDGALEMVMRWAGETASGWTDELARKAYNWFSEKTRAATRLFWWNDMVAFALEDALETTSADRLPRLTLPAEMRESAVQRYRETNPGYAYYHRQIMAGNYLSLQYWFFYSYNDWGQAFAGLNDHEGDWESMHLFFRLDRHSRPQEPPAYITFANHESRLTKPWDHPDITRVGTHPVGFVAAGSHATYPQRITYNLVDLYGLFDYATGDGNTIDHDEWDHRVDLNEVPWLRGFQGSWGTRFWLSTAKARSLLQIALGATPFGGIIGLTSSLQEIELPGVSAPRGPVGRTRPQYANPVAWAVVPE